MNDAEVHAALVRWLSARTALIVIQGEQGGIEPPTPYIVSRFTGLAAVRDNVQDVEYLELDAENSQGLKQVKASPVIETEWRYSIHCHGGESPSDHLRPIRSAAELAQAAEPLRPGLIIHELSQIRNVPEYINEAWEQRAQMDLFLRGLTKDGIIIDSIEHFSFEFERV